MMAQKQRFPSLSRARIQNVSLRLRNNIHQTSHGADDSLLDEAEKDLSECDKEIVILKLRLCLLENQRSEIQRRVGEYRSLLRSPIRRIPANILSDIFDWACPHNELVYRPNASRLRPSIPAFDLSSVCCYWRAIALDTSRLWSRLWFGPLGSRKAQYLLPQLKLCLSRSRSHLLEIDMEDFPYTFVGSVSIVDKLRSDLDTPTLQLLELVMSHSARWKYFAVVLRWPALQQMISLQSWTGQFPCLEALDICVFETTEDHVSLIDPKLNAPNLTQADLSCILQSTFPVVLPYHQLAELDADWKIDARGFVDLIQKCPNVESLICRGLIGNGGTGPASECPVSRLRRLWIFFEAPDSGYDGLRALLPMLTVPSLERLSVKQASSDRKMEHLPLLVAFLTREVHASHLSRLVLSQITVMGIQMIEILIHLTNLTSLAISWRGRGACPVTNSLLHHMNLYNATTSPLAPKLVDLTVEQTGKAFDGAVLVETILSRWTSDETERLQTVHAYVPAGTFDPLSLERLEHLKADGLDFVTEDRTKTPVEDG